MMTNARISILRKDVSGDLFQSLVELAPQGEEEQAFVVRLPADDRAMVGLLEKLHSAGLQPWNGGILFDRRRHFRFRLIREYDAADLEAADYLRLEPRGEIFDADTEGPVWDYLPGRTITIDKGLLKIEPRFVQRPEVQNRLNGGDDGGPIVSDAVRRRLESSGLVGVRFQPTLAVRREETVEGLKNHPLEWGGEHGPPWWELLSDVVLPPLSPTVTLITPRGEPVEPGRDDVTYVAKEGLYERAELRYRAKDLEALPPFDIAGTRERFGPLRDESRWLICSQRFYRWCVEQGIEAEWVPVRLE